MTEVQQSMEQTLAPKLSPEVYKAVWDSVLVLPWATAKRLIEAVDILAVACNRAPAPDKGVREGQLDG